MKLTLLKSSCSSVLPPGSLQCQSQVIRRLRRSAARPFQSALGRTVRWRVSGMVRGSAEELFEDLGPVLLQPFGELVHVEHVRREALSLCSNREAWRLRVQV